MSDRETAPLKGGKAAKVRVTMRETETPEQRRGMFLLGLFAALCATIFVVLGSAIHSVEISWLEQYSVKVNIDLAQGGRRLADAGAPVAAVEAALLMESVHGAAAGAAVVASASAPAVPGVPATPAAPATAQLWTYSDDDYSSDYNYKYGLYGFIFNFCMSDGAYTIGIPLFILSGVWPALQLLLMAVSQYPDFRRKRVWETVLSFLAAFGKWKFLYVWVVAACTLALRVSDTLDESEGMTFSSVKVKVLVDGEYELQATPLFGLYFLFSGFATLQVLVQAMHARAVRQRGDLESLARSSRGGRGIGADEAAAEERAAKYASLRSSFAQLFLPERMQGGRGWDIVGLLISLLLSLLLLFVSAVLLRGLFVPVITIHSGMDGSTIGESSFSLWGATNALRTDSELHPSVNNVGLIYILYALIFFAAAARQLLMVAMWLAPLPADAQELVYHAASLVHEWVHVEPFLLAIYMLAWTMEHVLEIVGGELVSEYGMTIRIVRLADMAYLVGAVVANEVLRAVLMRLHESYRLQLAGGPVYDLANKV